MPGRPMSDHLRRRAVSAKKGTSHSVAIAESGLLCDDINGVVCVLHQRTRAFQAEVLHCLCGCLACFGLEGTADVIDGKVGLLEVEWVYFMPEFLRNLGNSL